MPFTLNRKINNSMIGTWKLEEPVDVLLKKVALIPEDLEVFQKIKIEERKKQWLAVRVMLNRLMQAPKAAAIIYDDYKKPLVKDSDYKISISHSHDYAALIIDRYSETGIDIELIKPTVQKIAHKFLSDSEMKNINTTNAIDQMYVYWCAKEALYKLYGKKELDFKKNLMVHNFKYENKGTITAQIIKGTFHKTYNLWYEKMDNYMLVYVINKI